MAAVKKKTKSTKRARRTNPRADITRIVRDQIRVGASYPKMIQLLKQAGFSGKMLEEAKAIYQAEKAAAIQVARREIGPAAGKKLTAKQVASLKERQRTALPGVRLRNKGALKTAGKTVAKAAKTLYRGTGKVLSKIGKAMSNPTRLTDQELVVLRAMNRLDRGGLVSVRDLIKAISYPKANTKRILLRLAEKGIVALHKYDWPSTLTRDERKYMITARDGRGTLYYYNGAAIRDGADLPAEAYGRSNPRKRIRSNPDRYLKYKVQGNTPFYIYVKYPDVGGFSIANAAAKSALIAMFGRNHKFKIIGHPKATNYLPDDAKKVPGAAGSAWYTDQTVRNPQKRISNTGAFESILRQIRDRELHSAEFLVDVVARHMDWDREPPIQVQRKLIAAGMSRKAAGAVVRKAQVLRDQWKRGISPADERAKRIKKGAKKYAKYKRNDGAAERREQFAGSMTGYKDLYFPEGTPGGLSTLGPLVLIKTAAGTIQPTNGAAYLCQDANNRLYIGATKDAPLWAGPAESLGSVTRVEYTCKKPHLGEPGTVTYYHDFESPLPELRADGKGGLKFHGGGYTIKREGIVG